MIESGRIKTLAAEKGVLDIVIEKDYVLDWVLWAISDNIILRNNLVFKGGTALHKMYFSDWRFSEDLDFTTVHYINKHELDEYIPLLCNQIANKSGLRISLKGIDVSGDLANEWSFEVKLEYIGPRNQTGGNLPTVLLHITNNEPIMYEPVKKFVLNPYDDVPKYFAILTYAIEEILIEKLRTVLYQRCYPKDVYDLWRLLKETGNYIDIEKIMLYLSKKCLHRGIKHEGIPDEFNERVGRLQNQWDQGLKRQISTPPDFEIVHKELIDKINLMFQQKSFLEKGGTFMIELTYVLRYKKGDIEIEVQGDKAFVEEKFKELLNLGGQAAEKREKAPGEQITQTEKPMSLGEFMNRINPKSHGDKILVFGYYLEKIKGYESFNLDDIEKCYQDARLPKTKNFSPYITHLIRQGYLMDSEQKKDNKKAWKLTKNGIDYVENYEKGMDRA